MAERVVAVGAPLRDQIGDQREKKTRRVGHHVTRVPDQCERIAPEAAEKFDEGKSEGKAHRKTEDGFFRLFGGMPPGTVTPTVSGVVVRSLLRHFARRRFAVRVSFIHDVFSDDWVCSSVEIVRRTGLSEHVTPLLGGFRRTVREFGTQRHRRTEIAFRPAALLPDVP